MKMGMLFRMRRIIAYAGLAIGFMFAVDFYSLLHTRKRPVLREDQIVQESFTDVATEFRLLPDFSWPELTGKLSFELFTPPVVELRDGELLLLPANTWSALEQFQLEKLEEIPYRFQLEGYVEGNNGSVQVFIRDGKTGVLHTLGEEETLEGGELALIRCNFIGNAGENPIARAVVRDLLEERDRVLQMGMRALSGTYTILVRNGARDEAYELQRVGEKFAVQGIEYELAEVDPHRRTVSIRHVNSGELRKFILPEDH
jgi:hypothetical protein